MFPQRSPPCVTFCACRAVLLPIRPTHDPRIGRAAGRIASACHSGGTSRGKSSRHARFSLEGAVDTLQAFFPDGNLAFKMARCDVIVLARRQCWQRAERHVERISGGAETRSGRVKMAHLAWRSAASRSSCVTPSMASIRLVKTCPCPSTARVVPASRQVDIMSYARLKSMDQPLDPRVHRRRAWRTEFPEALVIRGSVTRATGGCCLSTA